MERRQAINNNLTAIKNKLETELSTARADLDEATKEVDLYLFIFKSFFLIFFSSCMQPMNGMEIVAVWKKLFN